MTISQRRAGGDAARPRAGRVARRADRAPTRASAACSSTPTARTVAEGWHRGAGSPHAEVDALRQAGAAARGTTAVVTLEPCNHTGRTGPCSGRWSTPAYAAWSTPSATPTPSPPGERPPCAPPASRSRAACSRTRPARVNREWTFAVDRGRPFVTWKFATTLDGRSAAADGTSRWVSSRAARVDTHRLRRCATRCWSAPTPSRRRPAADRPRRPTTARCERPAAAGRDGPARPAGRPAGLRRRRARPSTCAPATRTRRSSELFALDRQHVFLEGGPTLAAAFLDGRPRRRGRRLRRPDAARRRPARRRRPGHQHHRRRVPPDRHRRHRPRARRPGRRRQRPHHRSQPQER